MRSQLSRVVFLFSFVLIVVWGVGVAAARQDVLQSGRHSNKHKHHTSTNNNDGVVEFLQAIAKKKTPGQCLNDCSGKGVCLNARCSCIPGFFGDDCSQKMPCQNDCKGNGECRQGVCFCFPGFSGADCSALDNPCPMSSDGSVCGGPDKGVCHPRTVECVCFNGWSGTDCTVPAAATAACLNDCAGGGTCVNGACVCAKGRGGSDCSLVTPRKLSPPVMQSATSTSMTVSWHMTVEAGQYDPALQYSLQMAAPAGEQAGAPAAASAAGSAASSEIVNGLEFKEVYSGPFQSYTVSKLSSGQQRFFRVRAINSVGAGEWSDVVFFRTTAGEPGAPENLRADAITQNSITVAWDAPSSNGGDAITAYTLEMIGGSNIGWAAVYSGPAKTFRVSDLTPFVKYRFRVACQNSIGLSPRSTEQEFQTKAGVPAKPDPPNYDKSPSTPNVATITWTPPVLNGGDITHYTLSIKGPTTGYEAAYTGMATSYEVRDLRDSSTYFFRVSASNAAGTGPDSDDTELSTDPGCPMPPSPPSLQAANESALTIAWSTPGLRGYPVTGYELQMDQGDGTPLAKVGDYDMVSQTYTATGLNPFSQYRFRVQAYSVKGPSGYSATSTFETRPGIPSKPKPPTLTSFTPTSMTLAWQLPKGNGADVSGFRIEMTYVSPSKPDSDTTSIINLNSPVLAYNIDQMLPFTSYTFRIAAVNALGQGPWSDPVTYYTAKSPPSTPLPLMVKVAPKSVRLSWTPAKLNGGYLLGYVVEMRINSKPAQRAFCNGFVLAADTGPFLTVYDGKALETTVQGLQPATNYSFRYAVASDAGLSDYSLITTVTSAADVPDPITRISMDQEARTESQIVVQWIAPLSNGSPIERYELQLARLTPGSATASDVAPSGGPSTTATPTATPDSLMFHTVYRGPAVQYTLTGLQTATPYMVRVRAVNGKGAGLFSKPQMLATDASVPDTPFAPIVEVSQCTIRVSWQAPISNGAPITRYVLQQDDGVGTEGYQKVFEGRELSYIKTLETPDQGKKFRFRVKAANARGSSDWSPYNTDEHSVLAAPDHINPPTLRNSSQTSLDVQWEVPTNQMLCAYRLAMQARLPGAGSNPPFATIYTGPARRRSIPYLFPYTTYDFKLEAYNPKGSAGPVMASFTTAKEVPGVPLPPYSIQATKTAIEVGWTEPDIHGSPITSYNLEMAAPPNDEFHTVFSGYALSQIVTDLIPDTRYRFRIQGFNSLGCGEMSSPVVISTARCTNTTLSS